MYLLLRFINQLLGILCPFFQKIELMRRNKLHNAPHIYNIGNYGYLMKDLRDLTRNMTYQF